MPHLNICITNPPYINGLKVTNDFADHTVCLCPRKYIKCWDSVSDITRALFPGIMASVGIFNIWDKSIGKTKDELCKCFFAPDLGDAKVITKHLATQYFIPYSDEALDYYKEYAKVMRARYLHVYYPKHIPDYRLVPREEWR